MNRKPINPTSLETPGLNWRGRAHSWVAYWIPNRSDFPIRSRRLWPPSDGQHGPEPTIDEWVAIADGCARLQEEMQNLGQRVPPGEGVEVFDGTFASLIRAYQTDPDSPFREVRYSTAMSYEYKCRALINEIGEWRMSVVGFREFKRLHERLSVRDGVERKSVGYMLMQQLRMILTFGAAMELPECERLHGILHKMRFQMPPRRTTFITREQATAVRAKAHEAGYPSIALAQALQFDLGCRQKDAIGEWIPITEPGLSEIVAGRSKWIMGFRWEEIDGTVLIHRLSKSVRGRRAVASTDGKIKRFNLAGCRMIEEEFARIPEAARRGPMVVCEYTGVPWSQARFHQEWRKIARAAGVPDNVQNRDSRAGAITEASNSGVDLDTARRFAGHENVATTTIYSRPDDALMANVTALRNKGTTK